MWHLLMAHQQESFLPFSSWQSLSRCPSCMVLPIHSRTVWAPYLLQNLVALFLSLRTTWSSFLSPSGPRGPLLSLFTSSEPHGPLPIYLLQNCVVSLSMAATPRFKSQHPSSFEAPFLTPPTVSYTCQHPRILPALLGCHSKSGQVWPHSMEPIISKLSHRPCNQGELLPSPIWGGSHSHPPGSKHGHSYLTYL